jgi:hypothetical protein
MAICRGGEIYFVNLNPIQGRVLLLGPSDVVQSQAGTTLAAKGKGSNHNCWLAVTLVQCRAQLTHVAPTALRVMNLAPVPSNLPARQVHQARKFRVKCLCLINDFFNAGVRWAQVKAPKNAADMHIRRNVDGKTVGEWDFPYAGAGNPPAVRPRL